MKVLLLNGSPHVAGTTFRALSEVARTLNECGVETEIITVGNKRISGCVACKGCVESGVCVRDDKTVKEVADKISAADGLVIGTPVYYASLNGTLKSLLDRVFYSGKNFSNKPAAAVAVARRAGTTATLDILNKYFMINSMPVVSSQYWNMVFGRNAEEAEKDEEGMQTMRILGKNMAWLIKCINAGKENGVNPPEPESHVRTNFIR